MEHVTDDCTCKGKKCTKCQDVLCVGRFTRDKRLKSGLKAQCRICSNTESKEWRENNHKYDMERQRRYREQNPEKRRESLKKSREKHKERCRAYSAQYREKNGEQIRARASQRYYQNIEKFRERGRKEYARNREYMRAKWREYYAQKREYHNQRVKQYLNERPGYHAAGEAKRRTRKTQAGGSHTYQEWEDLKAKYNYTCLSCGKQEPEIHLHADHVIPVIKGGSSNIDNIQPLCRTCNLSKGRKTHDFRV